MHSEAADFHLFSLLITEITVTSHFDVIFIIIMCVERQNVVVKSDILTMLKDLKPRTILFSTRGRNILSIIDVARAKKQYMILWWVCLKWSFFTLFRSIWRKRQFIKIWFLRSWSVFGQFCCACFTQNIYQNYVLSVETCWLPTFHDIVRLFSFDVALFLFQNISPQS